MVKERKIYTIEFTAIVLLWTLAIVSPLLFVDNVRRDMSVVHVMWAECAVVGVVFLINRFLLMPRFFFAKRYTKYVVSLVGLIALLVLFVLYFDGVNMILRLFGDDNARLAVPPFMDHVHQGTIPPYSMPHMGAPPVINIFPPMFSVLILSVIVVALDMGISIAVKWIISEQKQSLSEKERISAQLSNLQSQVSPHFFMNTLNNIHALVDIDSSRAKQTIIELSGLMDYLLYESSNKESVLLQRELDFISSYINLMRLRYPQDVDIKFVVGDNMPVAKIPPLLFLNFIENAFKYGIDYEQRSYIQISFDYIKRHLSMSVVNSNHSATVKRTSHGLGIDNSRKRLELIYGDKYLLDIYKDEKMHSVNIEIPIEL